MSKTTNADKTPPTPDDAPAKPAAKKRAAKSVVSTDATEPSASPPIKRKTASTKGLMAETPVKKVATKRAAKKSAPIDLSPELPFSKTDAPSNSASAEPAIKATRAPRAKKVESEPTPVAVTRLDSTPSEAPDQPQRRIGRVPGGGPRVARDATSSTAFSAPSQPSQQESPQPQERAPHALQDDQARGEQPQRESRSKRRRDKRKRRNSERQDPQGHPARQPSGHVHPPKGQQRHRNEGRQPSFNQEEPEERHPIKLTGPMVEINGMLELAPKGFGFLRVPHKNFEQARDDVFVSPETIRTFNLRLGQWIHGTYQEGPRGPQLVEIQKINDLTPEEASKLPHFDELKAINPGKRISFESTPSRYTTRVVDIMAPVGRGQRGLIVSPPRSGKTTLLLHMAEAIREKYEESIHLMVVLVDERPEEVTEFRRALPGAEIYASSNDEQARNHTRVAELAIERAKRLVEAGKDVFLIMDSITRLARAYNGNMNNRGRGTGSGGLTIGSLEVPRRLFAAARNTRGGGSLTIMATALIQTNSRADEAIYMEFKGTGNMELVLDRKIAENYIYPAVDIFKSGTRREELLLADHMLHKIQLIRRGLSGHRPAEAMERLLFFLKKFPNNPQMLLEIKG
jgi:transcription termination factor Rho